MDNGPQFVSKFFAWFFVLLGTKLATKPSIIAEKRSNEKIQQDVSRTIVTLRQQLPVKLGTYIQLLTNDINT